MTNLGLGLRSSLGNESRAIRSTWTQRLLKTCFFGALLLVAVLEGIGSCVVHGIIARQQDSGSVINQAGRQRMRSQRLAKESLALISAQTPRHYLEALEHLPYDLILMDGQMSEMDGYEATQAIRQRERRVDSPCPWKTPIYIIAQ